MKPGPVTPAAGRNRPVSLDLIGDVVDPARQPGETMDTEELSPWTAPEVIAMASCVILAMAEAMAPADREAVFHLFRPGESSLRQRAAVAGCSPNSIRNRALRFRAALRDALHTPTTGNPLKQGDSGDSDDFR